jgi:endonuclease/exonuclease/phosphatase family metal-dependent hydrolase
MNNNSTSIKILSYNTHLFYKTIVPDQYQEETRINSLISKLEASDYDIVGLCEVWADTIKDTIINRLKIKFPNAYYHPNTDSGKLGSGLLLLSKYFISYPNFTPFKELTSWDAYSHKGVLYAKLQVPLPDSTYKGYHVLITHANSGGDEEGVAARSENFETIWNVIRALPYDNNPVILMGDFNIIAEDTLGRMQFEYRKITNSLSLFNLKDMYRSIHPEILKERGYTADAFKNKLLKVFQPNATCQSRIDYIYATNINSNNCTCEVPKDFLYKDCSSSELMDLSDHYPISLTIN